MRREIALMLASLLIVSCAVSSSAPGANTSEPDWKTFRSTASSDDAFGGDATYRPKSGSFVFRDLKSESDASLAHRLLGEVGQRIVYIDRKRDRWKFYTGDDDSIKDIVLYSQPESWGSAYGICRSEKYEIAFTDDGKIESVAVIPRYGVEGPIFQKDDFDWNLFRNEMCESVPGNHTPSYFPADDVLEAQDLAILLAKGIDLAGRSGDLPYKLACHAYRGEACDPDIRVYFSKLTLKDIDETSEINCS